VKENTQEPYRGEGMPDTQDAPPVEYSSLSPTGERKKKPGPPACKKDLLLLEKKYWNQEIRKNM